jgi:ankyrin repeat protein
VAATFCPKHLFFFFMACGGPPPHKVLLLATRSGDTAKALSLLSNKKKIPDFAYVDEQGRSVMHHAVRLENTSVLKAVLDACTVDDATRDNARNGRTPLMYAANFGRKEACSLLLEKVGKEQGEKIVAQQDVNFCNAVHYAADAGHADTLEYLLSYVSDSTRGEILASTDGGANTPLHKASAKGHASVARVLIDHGASVDVENCDFMTPARMASTAKQKDWETVISILEGGPESPSQKEVTKAHSFRGEVKSRKNRK